MITSVLVAGSWLHADDLSEMKTDIESLKREVSELRSLVQGAGSRGADASIDRKAGIRQRFEEDKKRYSEEQLREIEALYQSANKDLRSPEAKEALKRLIEKYPKANRTGCAVQYMGQMSNGEEKEEYLKMAIRDFGDCYYGSGVQVGAYARLYLGFYYKDLGKGDEAKALFDEIRKNYPDAVNHKGNRLLDSLPET
jgi:TolA-binding protein